jgi:drug/metabolite transporter (DMT)-like permease
MRVLAAYVAVVLIWSTTPLAIKWSGQGPGYLFGLTARMSIGLACVLPVMLLLRQSLPRDRRAWRVYFAGAGQIYGCMLVTYWSAQFIPSGWISVVFGLTPLITALLAAIWLRENSLSPGRLLAYGLGIAGLAVMFGSALDFGPEAVPGVAGILLASLIQSAVSVWLKRLNAHVPAFAQVAGSLLIAVPALIATWAIGDGVWPEAIPEQSLYATIYLGVIATTFGFTLYFYVLKHLPATRVALITLLTPVFSLLLGHLANAEPLTPEVLQGTALILGALLLHEATGRRRPVAVAARKRPLRTAGRSSRGSAP